MFSFYTPTKDYIYNKQLLLEFYETFYGIHDFTKPNQALETVAMHPKEEYFKNSVYDNRLRKFLELDIYAKTGIDFQEYLDLPRYEIESINRVMEEFKIKVNKLEEQNQEQIKREQDKQQREQKRYQSQTKNLPNYNVD